MLHDVTVVIFNPQGGAERVTVTVDADGGDDAASKAGIEAATLAAGRAWHIVAIGPAAAVPAPEAGLEGADAEDDPMVPDELEPAKRGPGRPKRVDG